MNILFITQTKFIALMLEKIFKKEPNIELHTRTEVDDVLYLVKDLGIQLLFLDVDELPKKFWIELSKIYDDKDIDFRLVLTGLSENIKIAPIRNHEFITKPIEARKIKDKLTSLLENN